jgi:ketosteroid isomerase-like protein
MAAAHRTRNAENRWFGQAEIRNLTHYFGRVRDVRTSGGPNRTAIANRSYPNGNHYANDYCFVFELRDGLIHRVREYMDTARGHRMIFGEGPQWDTGAMISAR